MSQFTSLLFKKLIAQHFEVVNLAIIQQPPALIVWGKNDYIFPEEGAHPYKRDLKNLEFHLLDTGHFAPEEDGAKMADLITCFMAKHTDFLNTHTEYREICKLAA